MTVLPCTTQANFIIAVHLDWIVMQENLLLEQQKLGKRNPSL